MRLRRPPRPQLRTRVLAGVLLVTLFALAGFDIAAVTGLRHDLLGQTDSQLEAVGRLYRPMTTQVAAAPISGQSAPAASGHAVRPPAYVPGRTQRAIKPPPSR